MSPTSRKKSDPTTGAEAPGFAGESANAELEHSEGGATTRDAMDAGVPMTPGQPSEPIGPEDALGPGPKRGDYADRLTSGPALVTEVIPEEERLAAAEKLADPENGLPVSAALDEVPRTRLVPATSAVGEVGDAPGKGGVSTAEAQAQSEAPVDNAEDAA